MKIFISVVVVSLGVFMMLDPIDSVCLGLAMINSVQSIGGLS